MVPIYSDIRSSGHTVVGLLLLTCALLVHDPAAQHSSIILFRTWAPAGAGRPTNVVHELTIPVRLVLGTMKRYRDSDTLTDLHMQGVS
jgi:hypothetical protein